MAIEIKNWKPHEKGPLIGFVDVFIPTWGIEAYGLAVFRKGHQQWISWPSREYQDKDTGETKRIAYFRFPNRKHADAFAEQVFEGIAKWQPSANEPKHMPDEDMPF